MKIGNKEFDMNKNHTYVMGILNVTPDSFSDGGIFYEKSSIDNALIHAEEMIREGVDIIDVGGESTRPGHEVVSEEEEIERTARVIEAIKARMDIPVSIDTYKDRVARAALESGADLLNDIWGFQYNIFNDGESAMAELAAESGAPVVLMYNDCLGRNSDERNDNAIARYLKVGSEDYLPEERVADRVVEGLLRSVEIAKTAGVSEDKIILDPGVGFAKTYKENLIVLGQLKYIADKTGLPMLLGVSRKSVIGTALDLPVDQREEGTITTSVLAAMAGYKFVRVHDVEKNVRALKMYEEISSVLPNS